MARFIKFMGRALVKWKKMQKAKMDDSDETLSILILNLNKLHVLLYYSNYKLHVNILWYVRNTFCFLVSLFMFSIHLPALSPLSTLGYSSPILHESFI